MPAREVRPTGFGARSRRIVDFVRFVGWIDPESVDAVDERIAIGNLQIIRMLDVERVHVLGQALRRIAWAIHGDGWPHRALGQRRFTIEKSPRVGESRIVCAYARILDLASARIGVASRLTGRSANDVGSRDSRRTARSRRSAP